VLIVPIVTEQIVAKKGKMQFKVHDRATKADVKKAFKTMYGVDIVKVNMLNMPEKNRTRGGKTMLRKRPFRKAEITLPEGTTVDTNVFVK
jgi:ribosomal protein L23